MTHLAAHSVHKTSEPWQFSLESTKRYIQLKVQACLTIVVVSMQSLNQVMGFDERSSGAGEFEMERRGVKGLSPHCRHHLKYCLSRGVKDQG